MRQNLESFLQAIAVLAALSLSGCGSGDTDTTPTGTTPSADAGCTPGQAGCTANDAGSPAGPSEPGTPDLPATGAEADVQSWLTLAEYKKGTWKCEPEPHAARSPSPHGMNMICSNATLGGHGAGEYPVGSAAVKELYEGDKVIGRAVYRKLRAGGGESWYWYEDMNGSVVANGTGDTGTAKSVCVGCHEAAGSDAAHSGHDFVYTQVK